ncbi:MAG: nuclear transport factor 2 family protein [Parvularculaceae bacterium]
MKLCTFLSAAIFVFAAIAPVSAALAAPAEATFAGRTPEQVDELLSRTEINNLISDYYYVHDRKMADAVADYVTDDMTWGVEGGKPIVGKEAYFEHFRYRTANRFTRHLTTNVSVKFGDRDHATVTRIVIYYAAEHVFDRARTIPWGLTEYVETVERGGDGKWRFSSRHVTPMFGPQ